MLSNSQTSKVLGSSDWAPKPSGKACPWDFQAYAAGTRNSESWEKPQKLNDQIFLRFISLQKRDQTQHAAVSLSPRAPSSKPCLGFSTCGNSWVIKMERLPLGFKGNWIWLYMLLYLGTMGWVKYTLSVPALNWLSHSMSLTWNAVLYVLITYLLQLAYAVLN